MQHAYLDISRDLEGEAVVFACFDLRQEEVAAAVHAVHAVAGERYRTSSMSADDVLELRELTALADELGGGVPADRPVERGGGSRPGEPGDGSQRGEPGSPSRPGELGGSSQPGELGGPSRPGEPGGGPNADPVGGALRIVFRPARLSTFREAVARFVESRDEAEWIRDEDREPLALLRGMLLPLEQLCHEALRAALSPESRAY